MHADDPFDALRNTDPAGSLPPVHEHWRTRETIIMNHTPDTLTTPRRPWRLLALPAGAIAVLAAAVLIPSTEPELQPISVSGSARGAEMSSAPLADSRLALWAPVEYRLAPGVDAPAGSDSVWRFAAASEDGVSRLADLFGEKAQVSVSDPSLAPVSYTAGGLYASSNGYFSWSNLKLQDSAEMRSRYAAPSCSSTAPSATSTDPASGPVPEPAVTPSPSVPCGQVPQPVFDLPDDASALAQAAAYLPGAELSVAGRSEWSVSVSASYRVGDHVLEGQGFAEVNDLGVLWVSGMFTEPEYMGKYPTVSAAEALARLDSGMMIQPAAVSSRTDAQAADQGVSSSVEVAPGVPDSSVALGNPASQFCVDNGGSLSLRTTADGEIGICTLPDGREVEEWEFYRSATTPAPRVVELVSVSSGFLPLWDDSGMVWVVPSWVYRDADGVSYPVVALSEEYFKIAPVQSDVPVEVPVQEPLPGAIEPAAPGSSADLPVPAFDTKSLFGLSLEEASSVARSAGFSVRVVSTDGEYHPVTKDYRTDRIGVDLQDGVVVSAMIG